MLKRISRRNETNVAKKLKCHDYVIYH